MVKVTLDIKWNKTATIIYAGKVTSGVLNGTDYPHPQDENWLTDPYWVLGTNYFGTNLTADTYKNVYTNVDVNTGDRIPLGFDDNGVAGVTYVTFRLKVNGVIKREITFSNLAHDFSYYRIKSTDSNPEPIYLERLSQLANNSRAVTRNSKSL